MEGEPRNARAMLADFSGLCALAALCGLAASFVAGAFVLLIS